MATNYTTVNAFTQKARGVQALAQAGYRVPKFVVYGPGKTWDSFPVFVRPCPETPRHGFEDSRIANNMDEIRAIVRRARKVDPRAEALLMNPIQAKGSGILVPGLLTLGHGNDSVTSGQSSVSLRIRSDLKYNSTLLELSGVKGTPYMEMVLADKTTEYGATEDIAWVVQLRDGPAVPTSANYVPKTFTVVEVVKAEGDLLEWETRAKKFRPGTVVWQPKGSLSSHYAVHCMLNKVPVVTWDKAPEVGQTIPATNNKIKDEAPWYTILAKEISRGLRSTVKLTPSEELKLALFVLHSTPMLQTTAMGCYVTGAGLAAAARLATAACLGEARHKEPGNKKSRPQVYALAFSDIKNAILRLPWARNLFVTANWSGSFGGKKWRDCADATIRLVDAVTRLSYAELNTPTNSIPRKCLNEALTALNAVINAAHNCGVFLNKFGNQAWFDQAANGDPKLMSEQAAVVWQVLLASTEPSLREWPMKRALARTALPKQVKQAVEGKTSPTPAAVLPKPKLVTAQIRVTEIKSGSKMVHVQYKTDHDGLTTQSYQSKNLSLNLLDDATVAALTQAVEDAQGSSYAGSGTPYVVLKVEGDHLALQGGKKLWTVATLWA